MNISPLAIDRWMPANLPQVAGCNSAKGYFEELLIGPEIGGNTLLIGPSGTGKSACVKAYVRSLMCGNRVPATGMPCGTCSSCTSFDVRQEETGLFAEAHGRASSGLPVHYFPVNCGQIAESDLRELLTRVDSFLGHRVVFLDEVHRLKKSRLDESLLVPLREKDAMFIAATMNPEELDHAFLNRFSAKLITSRPTPAELALFIQQRCEEWNFRIESDDAVSLLVQRSQRNMAHVMAVLASLARKNEKDRVLNAAIVDGVDYYIEALATEEAV